MQAVAYNGSLYGGSLYGDSPHLWVGSLFEISLIAVHSQQTQFTRLSCLVSQDGISRTSL